MLMASECHGERVYRLPEIRAVPWWKTATRVGDSFTVNSATADGPDSTGNARDRHC